MEVGERGEEKEKEKTWGVEFKAEEEKVGGASLFILVFLSHCQVNVSVRWGQDVGVCSSGNIQS